MRVSDYINTANNQRVEADNDGSYTSVFARLPRYCEDMTSGYKGRYRMNPHERRRFKIRRRHLSEELEKVLWRREAFIGADGSIIQDGDDVYLLEVPEVRLRRPCDRVMKIDYFHGYHWGVPCAQVWNDDEEENSLAMNMVQLGWWGNIVYCITVLQRKWRNRRWRLRVQPGVIQLAKDTLMQVSSVSFAT